MIRKFFQLMLAISLFAAFYACESDKAESRSSLKINGGAEFLSLDGLGREGKLTVQSNQPWTVQIDPNVNWIHFSSTSGEEGESQVGVVFDENKGGARTAVLQFLCGNDIHSFRVSQNAQGLGFDSPEYYFYVTFGTLPTLYAGLHLLSHDKPSYVFYERSKTFDPLLFPSYAQVFVEPGKTANASDSEMRKMAAEMKKIILDINSRNPNAMYGLYVDDLRCPIGYEWFVKAGIDSSRVKVTMLSDGTGTYANFYDYFGDAATAQQNWDQYASEVEELDWNHGGAYPQTRVPDEFQNFTWPFYLSTRPDYRLMLQDGSLLETGSPYVEGKLDEMKMANVTPLELLQALTPAARQRFYRMASFDYDKYAAMFDGSGKKNLIIIGTTGDAQQKDYVTKIYGQYSGEYAIFFKPHPADQSSASYEKDFPGLTLLPGQMPFEIFVWSLIDKIDLIGGYSSTVFLTVPIDKVGFIFAAGPSAMPRPLNLLFQNAQDVEWVQL